MTKTNVYKKWDSLWGSLYQKPIKEDLQDFILQLAQAGLLGKVIMDLGCGYNPVTKKLPDKKFKKIYIDVSYGINYNTKNEYNLFVKFDLHNILYENRRDFKKYMKKLYSFLGNRYNDNKLIKVDTIIYSDVLNYIDYRKVLKNYYIFLNKGGRKIIFNKINKGIYELFSDKRPLSNWEILTFLQKDLRMTIEYVRPHPIIIGDNYEIENANFIFIAKKIYD